MVAMKILAINQYYAPDESATSQLLTDLCEHWLSQGHRVSVVASRGGYAGEKASAWVGQVRGVRVIRPPSTALGRGSIAARVADYGTFLAGALVGGAVAGAHDVAVALTSPPGLAGVAAVMAAAKRMPLVMWVQDVYPELAVAFGVTRAGGLVERSAGAMQRLAYRRAARIVALSDGMAERLVGAGAPSERLRVIPNWADGEALRPIEAEASVFRREHAGQAPFVVAYCGNIGVGHEVETLARAAWILQERGEPTLLLFIGGGGRSEELRRLLQGASNVRFLPHQPRAVLADCLGGADLHLISLREGLDGLLVPSKMYGVLACGRPIAFVGPAGCEVARQIRAHELGWAGLPGQAEQLADFIVQMRVQGQARLAMGQRARELFVAQFDKAHAFERWTRVLQEAAGAACD